MAVMLDTSSSAPDRRLAVWQTSSAIPSSDSIAGRTCTTRFGVRFRNQRSGLRRLHASIPAPRGVPHAVADRARQRGFRAGALGNSGVNGVYQDGREAVVSAGQFVIYDTTRPTSCASTTAFADHFSDASEVSATAHRLVRCVDCDDLLQRSSTRATGLSVPARHEQDDRPRRSRTATRCWTRRWIWSRWPSPTGCVSIRPTSRFTDPRCFIGSRTTS